MPNRCIVAGCDKTPKDDVSLHLFPKEEKLLKIWTAKVRLTRAKWKGPTQYSTICSDHFAHTDYEDFGLYSEFGMKFRRKLKATAVPVIRLPSNNPDQPVSADKPTRPAAMKRERKRVRWNKFACSRAYCPLAQPQLLPRRASGGDCTPVLPVYSFAVTKCLWLKIY